MKHHAFLAVLVALVLVGCEYQVPLAEKQNIPVDEAILGLWTLVPGAGEEEQKMLILKYTDTDYIVQYPVEKDTMFFRAYPIKVDGTTYMQVQLIGVKDGVIDQKDRKYHLVSYKVTDNVMEMRILNSEMVDKNLRDSSRLMEEFLKKKDDTDLFGKPAKFKKAQKR